MINRAGYFFIPSETKPTKQKGQPESKRLTHRLGKMGRYAKIFK